MTEAVSESDETCMRVAPYLDSARELGQSEAGFWIAAALDSAG